MEHRTGAISLKRPQYFFAPRGYGKEDRVHALRKRTISRAGGTPDELRQRPSPHQEGPRS
jgi:hypothetical protein